MNPDEGINDKLPESNQVDGLHTSAKSDALDAEDSGLDTLQRLHLTGASFEPLTHYLFRYPAKFHPPVIRTLLDQYTNEGDHILDPFCGSGTLLVEAAVSGRHAIGTDIDPVAIFVSHVKTRLFDLPKLSESCELLLDKVHTLRRSKEEYIDRKFNDLSQDDVDVVVETEELWVPAIPNLHHWFRRYVVVDLARIHRQIMQLPVPNVHRDFLRLCFASIIRASSNADPVPVSGLEVTAHMKRKDEAGRVINPYALLEKALKRAIIAVTAFKERANQGSNIEVFQADATRIASSVRSHIDIVITSPPYHNAVDYYRRHQLEMFWLGLTSTHADRLALLPQYIGRSKIPQRHPFVANEIVATPLAQEWELRIRNVSPKRADEFKHYVVAMHKTFEQLAQIIPVDGHALFVVGHSTWNSTEIPAADLFAELAGASFKLTQQLWYPIENRYMSYRRRNGANIDKEYVLVFRRSASLATI